MTGLLDDPQKIKALDRSAVLDALSLLPEQIKQAWEEVFQLRFDPSRFKKVQNMVVAGMGGSALGARIIDALNFEVLDLPLEIVNGYHLPAYVDQNSLVIISSYSGNTEETLACCRKAIRARAKIFIICTGGKLADLAEQNNLPAYIFRPLFNPSGQPRLGLGYSTTAQLALLSRIGLIRLDEAEMKAVINYLQELKMDLAPLSPTAKNKAKQAALDLKNKAAVWVAAEHLEGAAHAAKNLLNENSKTFSASFSLPEMNHHLLEGLRFPTENKKMLQFLFLESDFYDAPIKKRFQITQKVVAKNGLDFSVLSQEGNTRLIQVFEAIYLAGLISAYLAILYQIDPAPIPWVDFFKAQLAAHG